jgi:serine protease Do
LSFLVGNLPVGTRVPVEFVRDGKRQSTTVVLGERPSEEQLASAATPDNDNLKADDDTTNASAARESLGLSVQPLTVQIAQQLGLRSAVKGLVVGGVDPSSDAAAKGFQRGDVIFSVNYKSVTTANDIVSATKAAKNAGRSNILLEVQPKGQKQSRYIAIKFKVG